MFGNPRFLVLVVVLAGSVLSTMVAIAYQYPIGLALACGLLAAGWAVLLSLSLRAPFLLRLALIVPLSLGVAVIANLATQDGHSASAPFLALAVTTAVHVAVLMGVRRFGHSAE